MRKEILTNIDSYLNLDGSIDECYVLYMKNKFFNIRKNRLNGKKKGPRGPRKKSETSEEEKEEAKSEDDMDDIEMINRCSRERPSATILNWCHPRIADMAEVPDDITEEEVSKRLTAIRKLFLLPDFDFATISEFMKKNQHIENLKPWEFIKKL